MERGVDTTSADIAWIDRLIAEERSSKRTPSTKTASERTK
jgi:hypothetical protein